MTTTTYALKHRGCGHVATAGNERSRLEQARGRLAAGGYFQWRVQMATDDDLLALLENRMCDTCRIDPLRALLVRDEKYGPVTP